MATGRLGIADLAATTLTTLYTCPTGTFTVLTVNICNRTASPVAIRLAVASTATPTLAEYVEYDVTVSGNQVIERTGIVVAAGQQIVVRSSSANISAVAYGIETSTV